jgi:phosphoribosyl 1,2-cyclic phosphate phosphodiesterase
MHLTVDEAVEFSKKVGAHKTWLIHTSHELDYEKTNTYLPDNVRMAYDGLSLPFHIEVNDGHK